MKTKTISVALLLLIGAGSARAYTIENAKWNPGIVEFYLDLGQYNAVAAKELAQWDQYTGDTRLRTTSDSTVNGSAYFMDGRNSMVWSSTIPDYQMPSNILGMASFYNLNSQGDNDGIIREADVVINASYTWTTGSTYDIGYVILHEIGHAIGLGHSAKDAVMFPYYTGNAAILTPDDIAGAQFIYGPRTGHGSTVPDSGSTAALMSVALAALAVLPILKRR